MIKNTAVFCTGGTAYMIIELLWRGYSHWSMFFLGGVCFAAAGVINKRLDGCRAAAKMAAVTAVITAFELAFGYIINIRLGLGVWDYSDMPYNFMGQICLKYAALWFALSYFCIELNKNLRQCLEEPAADKQ